MSPVPQSHITLTRQGAWLLIAISIATTTLALRFVWAPAPPPQPIASVTPSPLPPAKPTRIFGDPDTAFGVVKLTQNKLKYTATSAGVVIQWEDLPSVDVDPDHPAWAGIVIKDWGQAKLSAGVKYRLVVGTRLKDNLLEGSSWKAEIKRKDGTKIWEGRLPFRTGERIQGPPIELTADAVAEEFGAILEPHLGVPTKGEFTLLKADIVPAP